MATTYFIDGTTPIVATWLNDVNAAVYAPTGKQGTVTATAGQTVFTVPFTYVVGSKTLNVYINGVRQILSSSYTETSTTSVTFTAAVPVTAVVEFVVG